TIDRNRFFKLAALIYAKHGDKIKDYVQLNFYEILFWSKLGKEIGIKIYPIREVNKLHKEFTISDDNIVIITLLGKEKKVLKYPPNIKFSYIIQDPEILNFDFIKTSKEDYIHNEH